MQEERSKEKERREESEALAKAAFRTGMDKVNKEEALDEDDEDSNAVSSRD